MTRARKTRAIWVVVDRSSESFYVLAYEAKRDALAAAYKSERVVKYVPAPVPRKRERRKACKDA